MRYGIVNRRILSKINGLGKMKTAPHVLTSEKDFYLKEFRGKSLLFVLRAQELTLPADGNGVAEVLGALIANETRIILLLETHQSVSERHAIDRLYQCLSQVLHAIPTPMLLLPEADEDQLCLDIWEILRKAPVFIGLWPAHARTSACQAAQLLSARLKVYKLVLLDQQGGLNMNGEPLSFLNGPKLEELQARSGKLDLSLDRRLQLETARKALEGGVTSVSLCSPKNSAQELFTYEGNGTFFTLTDYCQVERLALDDFYEVERFIERGEREGALKKRTPYEISQLLLHGYGARLGRERDLVGFCSLLPYPAGNAGEIAGLYTLTRFHGEGIGSRLVLKIISEGQQRHLSYLFACTNQAGAQRLFERFDFHQVTPDEVPATKWSAYASERIQRMTVYKKNLL